LIRSNYKLDKLPFISSRQKYPYVNISQFKEINSSFTHKQEEHSSSTAITYSSNKNKHTRTMNTYH